MLFDLIVIGSGPAGQRAALQGAKAGKKAVIIEDGSAVGGGCVHSGTLPSKSFRESVYRWSLGSRGTLGQENEVSTTPSRKSDLPDISRLLRRVERVVKNEERIIADQLKRNGITIVHGRARLVSANDVEVTTPQGTQKFTAPVIFVAVGASPIAPSHIQIDGKRVHDSNTILSLKQVPKSMLVLGGGIIGCEYASMFSMAGTQVFLVDRRHEILASVDREVVACLMERFSHQGTEIILEAQAESVETTSKGVNVRLSNGREIQVDTVLVAQGRFGNIKDLGLDVAGVQHDERGLIQVDKHYRTSVPNIYAMGDVIGFPALASTSMEQGRIACCHAFQLTAEVMSTLYPYGIYTIPEISMVGKTEEELQTHKVDYVAGRARYRELARGQIVGDQWGLLKMLVDKKTLRILGVHIIGDSAADLIHIGQAVMALEGDVRYFIQTVFNYPTLAEAYKTAAFHAINQIKGVTKTR